MSAGETVERRDTDGVEIRRVRDSLELASAVALRRRVFCDEQGVPVSDEVDGRDPDGLHLVATENGSVIAACRLIFSGSTAQFSRLAVEASERRRGIASLMLAQAETEARRAGSKRIVLHAQTYATPLYESAGYVARGAVFRDAGIEHIAMEKRLA